MQGKRTVPGVLKFPRPGRTRLVSQFKSHLEGVMQWSRGDCVGWEVEERDGKEGRDEVC